MGGLGGQNIKSPGNVMNCQENKKKILVGGGVEMLGVTILKVWEIS